MTIATAATLTTYYRLTKPGIICGNAITAAAGFLLAAQSHVDIKLFIATLAGLSLVIASGCVCNNYIDRGIDAKMARTKDRALASGQISVRAALLYAAVLGVAGTALLALYANLPTALLALFGFIAYVVIYGVAKRRSVHGTVVGSISGAIPPVVGYCAVSNRLDLGALLLFVILVCWQMPHFYAIAMYRLADYKAAGIPVLPLQSGMRTTKIQIIGYIIAFMVASAALTLFHYTGWVYLVVALGLGLYWLWIGHDGFAKSAHISDDRWARRMFGVSLLVMLGISLAIAVDSFI